MKKFSIFVLIVLALCCVAVATCPDKEAHKEAILSVLSEKINENIKAEQIDESSAVIANALGSKFLALALDNRLLVNNYFVFSKGDILKLNGEKMWVSGGVFGHVFTFSKEDLDKALERVIK